MSKKPQSRRATSSSETSGHASTSGRPTRRKRLSFGRKATLAAVFLLVGLMFVPTVSTGIRQAQQISALERDNEATEQEIKDLEKKQRDLKDPKYMERRARDEYHYAKPGEKIFIVESDKNEHASTNQANKGERQRPWYVELSDSLKTVGLATEE